MRQVGYLQRLYGYERSIEHKILKLFITENVIFLWGGMCVGGGGEVGTGGIINSPVLKFICVS